MFVGVFVALMHTNHREWSAMEAGDEDLTLAGSVMSLTIGAAIAIRLVKKGPSRYCGPLGWVH